MTWATLAEGLRVWVRTYSGVQNALVTWDGEAYPWTDHQTILRLSIVSAVGEVPDRVVRTLNVSNLHDVSVSSVLLVTLQIRAEHETHEGSGKAMQALESLRIRLKLDAVRAALSALDVALVGEMSAVTRVPTISDGRALGVWSAELRFRALFDYADPTSADVFDRIEGSATIDNAGTNIPLTFVGDPYP